MKEIRLARGMTQQQLADAVGISSQAIHYYETGQREPPFDIFKRICEVLGCTPNDLMGVTVKEEA